MRRYTTRPYGTWPSPITAQTVAAGTKPLSAPRIDGAQSYWLEGLAAEGGRVAGVRHLPSGECERLTPAPYNLRSRVHEYGGGAWIVSGGVVYFSNFADNLVYRLREGGQVDALTRDPLQRHADFELDAGRRRLIAVREDHLVRGQEPVNLLVALSLDGAESSDLASGFDFYAAPRLSPDGRQLAWLCWNHPQMPFNGTELWLADFDAAGALVQPRRIAGGPDESLCQPVWSPDGHLYVVSDRSGYWNLYRVEGASLHPVLPMRAEFGRPQWVFAQSMYGFNGPREIVATCIEQGVSKLGRIDLASGRWQPIVTEFTDIDELRVGPGFVLAIAGSPARPHEVVRIALDGGPPEVLASSVTQLPDTGYLQPPQALAIPSFDGRTTHAFYYPPASADHTGPADERPPLIVTSHGGPTSMSGNSLRPSLRFWTSRGFAVLDVNYGGSTGFGRAYMDALKAQWGIVDVQDCVAAARYVCELGLVDPDRMAIRGASASGFTTLCALAFHKVFKAGASYFGVSDLAGLDADTHKFESRYTSYLVAPPPERDRLYRERSPLAHADRLSCPMIFFQGLDDKVVVPAQSEIMVNALRARGIPVAYLTFEGEGHGFRQLETIRRTLEAELSFYGQVFGFAPADPVEPPAM